MQLHVPAIYFCISPIIMTQQFKNEIYRQQGSWNRFNNLVSTAIPSVSNEWSPSLPKPNQESMSRSSLFWLQMIYCTEDDKRMNVEENLITEIVLAFICSSLLLDFQTLHQAMYETKLYIQGAEVKHHIGEMIY